MKLAHISDLHFSSTETWPPQNDQAAWAVRLNDLKDDLASVRPDLLFVTGDIADNAAWEVTEGSLRTAWQNALAFLSDVCHVLYGDAATLGDRLFVIPGNHDAKILGNIRRADLEAITKSAWFRMARIPLGFATDILLRLHGGTALLPGVRPLFDRQLREALMAAPSSSAGFREVFGPLCESRFVPSLGVYVLCVDSNSPDDSFLNFAQGAVPPAEMQRVRRQVDAWRAKDEDFDRRYRFALLHHHPLPIALAEGAGHRLEGEEFLLLRNAGSFISECARIGIDFVLHGHKHCGGFSTISFPSANHHNRTVVIGAGSVQRAFDGHCSYNLVRQRSDGAWDVEVRSRPERVDGVVPYGVTATVPVATADDERTRLYAAARPKVSVEHVDIVGTIDEWGDIETWQQVGGIRPHEGDLREYRRALVKGGARATFEPINFEDRDDEHPNVIVGRFPLDPPARPERPHPGLEIGVRGIGIYTFSAEYAHRITGSGEEDYFFGVAEWQSYGALSIAMNFPPELPPPIKPRVQVLRPTGSALSQAEWITPLNRLVDAGRLEEDARETDRCLRALKFWPRQSLAFIVVPYPLSNRIYRLVWELPRDEYEVCTFAGEPGFGRALKATVARLHKRLAGLDGAALERKRVEEFLMRFGDRLLVRVGSPDAVRIDLGIPVGGSVEVVSSVQGDGTGHWRDSPLKPSCRLGETLRGKAFLQRQIRHYTPNIPDSAKDPNRDASERVTKHQIAFPLVYPPAPPNWPRVGVLTVSSENERARALEKLLQPVNLSWALTYVHTEMVRLAADLDTPLPALPARFAPYLTGDSADV